MSKNKDTINGIRNAGIALALFLIIALTGISESWAIIPVSAAITGGMAWLFTKSVSTVVGWSAIGLIASILWHIFGV